MHIKFLQITWISIEFVLSVAPPFYSTLFLLNYTFFCPIIHSHTFLVRKRLKCGRPYRIYVIPRLVHKVMGLAPIGQHKPSIRPFINVVCTVCIQTWNVHNHDRPKRLFSITLLVYGWLSVNVQTNINGTNFVSKNYVHISRILGYY